MTRTGRVTLIAMLVIAAVLIVGVLLRAVGTCEDKQAGARIGTVMKLAGC